MRIRPSARLLRAYASEPWAITAEKLDEIVGFVDLLASGGMRAYDDEPFQQRAAIKASNVGSVAVLPLRGTIFPRGGMFADISGGVSTEAFGKLFDQAVSDSSVSAIVLDVDSPGGQVAGVPELAEKVFAARGVKPIVAVANFLAASGAYWIASAAGELVASPSSEVGSIGVIGAHIDESAAEEKAGIKVTTVTAGKYKAVGHPSIPLSEEARGLMQARVDLTYDRFVKAVAKHRGVSVGDVKSGFGEGYIVGSRAALDGKMVDRIATLDETVARLASRRGNAARGVAAVVNISASALSADWRSK